MLSTYRQIELFKSVISYFNHENLVKPNFEITDKCDDLHLPSNNKDESIFDILGYFSCTTPKSVFICNKKVKDYSNTKSLNSFIVAEIIAIHEISHYVHYSLLGPQLFCDVAYHSSTLFVESFAQLLTHRVCNDLSFEHIETFEKMKQGQSSEYTDYCTVIDNNIGKPICSLPWNVLQDSFINITELPDVLYELICNKLETYLNLNYPFWWYDIGFTDDENLRLDELGLADSKFPLLTMFEEKQQVSLTPFIS